MVATTRGLVFVHSTPSALRPHIEWAAGGVLGAPIRFEWTSQPAERGAWRSELSWTGAVGTGAKLASAFKSWERVRFEVTEEATSSTEGSRWSYTPRLGIFHAAIGVHGDIMVPEERLKAALVRESLGGRDMRSSIEELLGVAWDDELEAFRQAGEGAPVRWLHQVV